MSLPNKDQDLTFKAIVCGSFAARSTAIRTLVSLMARPLDRHRSWLVTHRLGTIRLSMSWVHFPLGVSANERRKWAW